METHYRNFYCQKICGTEGFSIDDWNKAFDQVEKSNLSEIDRDKILFPDKCKSQCFTCMAIVGERQIKTKNTIS